MANKDEFRSPSLRLMRLLYHHSDGAVDFLDFGLRLTVITGASDTGKSTIVETLRFMFGGNTAPSIPELDGYTSITLVFESLGDIFSITRGISDNSALLANGDIGSSSDKLDEEKLYVGKKTKGRSITSTFLECIGLSDLSLVWEKSPDKLRRPSMREIVDFYIVDESRITSKYPVGRPYGQYTRNLLDDRLLHFLVTGKDDTSTRSENTGRLQDGARRSAYDEMLKMVREQIPDGATREQAERRRDFLNDYLRQIFSVTESLFAERTDISEQVGVVNQRFVDETSTLNENSAMSARFDLLRTQYTSDLDRLEMVREAGEFLGLLRFDTCPICGARHDDQHIELVLAGSHKSWEEAVDVEMQQTRSALHELDATLSQLSGVIKDTQTGLGALDSERRQLLSRVKEIEKGLGPQQDELERSLDEKVRVEQTLSLFQWIAKLSNEQGEPNELVALLALDELTDHDITPLVSRMRSYLASWGLQNATTLEFSLKARDVVYEAKLRSDHGKGIRALLYAAFTLALNESTYRAPRIFIGFVVLDSPLVTFADPDTKQESSIENGEVISEAVSRAFYRSLLTEAIGQVIIIENLLPQSLESDDDTVVLHHFTKSEEIGRYGLLRQLT